MAEETGFVYLLSSDDTDSLKQNLTTILEKLSADCQPGTRQKNTTKLTKLP